MVTASSFTESNVEALSKYSYSIKIIYENGEVVTTAEQTIETN